MKSIIKYFAILSAVITISCEDKINPDLADAPPILVIDAWVDNLSEPQTIRVTRSQNYFDNTLPPGVTGATVFITDNHGSTFNFTETGNGSYTWTPPAGTGFGAIGDDYTLTVTTDGETFQASSSMGRIPTIDSVTYRFEEETLGFPDSFFAEFWARDVPGSGDTYWIKSYKNGQLLNKPSEINVAFDAGFSAGGNLDGIVFIPPIRDAINPFDQDEQDEFLPSFVDGDSVYVEVYSITEEAFDFLVQVQIQTDRPGGFAELFAQPLSNVSSNIVSTDPSSTTIVQGFFNVSAVTGDGKTLDASQVPKE